jgi:hypothetical protein
MLENWVTSRIFGPKREEMTKIWIKLREREHHDLHFSSNVMRTIRSRWMRPVWTVEYMGQIGIACRM